MKSVNTVLDVPVDFSFFQMPKIDIKEIGPVAQMVDPVHKVIDGPVHVQYNTLTSRGFLLLYP